jgi:hypothetical protein
MISVRILDAVGGQNIFGYTTELKMAYGDTTYLYLQLFDPAINPASEGFNPGGLRYIPATGATMNVTFLSLDATKQFSRAATNPFAGDTSIFRVSILATDPLIGTVSLKIVLNESSVLKTVNIPAALSVSNFGSC